MRKILAPSLQKKINNARESIPKIKYKPSRVSKMLKIFGREKRRRKKNTRDRKLRGEKFFEFEKRLFAYGPIDRRDFGEVDPLIESERDNLKWRKERNGEEKVKREERKSRRGQGGEENDLTA
jgi:hypothetical protein